MTKFFRKNWIHLFLWTTMLAYLIVAPEFYTKFILKNGKPVQFTEDFPKPTERIRYSVDRLDFRLLNRQVVYNLWGWAFVDGDYDQARYQRWVVLQSPDRTYFFSATTADRPNLQNALKDISIDLSKSGLSADLAMDMLQPGTYEIGILFKRPSHRAFYTITNKVIVRTPNRLLLKLANEKQ